MGAFLESCEKKMGTFLEECAARNDRRGFCESCGNLVSVGDTALGCLARDKLIIPSFQPYPGGGNRTKERRRSLPTKALRNTQRDWRSYAEFSARKYKCRLLQGF